MERVLLCLTEDHDLRLVAVAGIVSLLTSIFAFDLLAHARQENGRARWLWLLASAFVAGGGIWATHFIAMLAYEPGLPLGFAIWTTLASGVSGIVVAGAAFFATLTAGQSRWAGPSSGALLGGGIAILHYVGMAAVVVPGLIIWDFTLVAWSIVLGCALGAAALILFLRARTMWGRLGAAITLSIAACTHHFTGMAAVAIIPWTLPAEIPADLPRHWIVAGIAIAMLTILGFGLLGLVFDRKRAAAEALKVSFGLLFDNNPMPMWIYDRETLRFLVVNDAAMAHYGYSRDHFLAMTILDIRPEEDREATRATVRNLSQYVQGTVCRLLRADGEERLTAIYNHTLPLEGRMVVLVAAIDMTDQVRSQRELGETREFLNTIVENIPMMVFVKESKENRFVLINRAGEQLLGIPREALLGRNDHDFFPKEQADFFVARDREVLQSGELQIIPEEPVQTSHNGVRLLNTKKIAVRDQDGEPRYLLGMSEDVTDRKSLEHQLLQAQKMEAVGQLTGGLSHDFNNLLGIIIGNLDLLQTRIIDSPEARELLEEALDASFRGADLNRRLLAFARRQPLQPRQCDLNEVVNSAAKLLSRVLGEHIEVSVHGPDDLGKLMVDPAQLEAALTNLAVNARDAMPNGGRLTLHTCNVTLDADYAGANPGVTPGDYVALEVSDTGTGIPPEVLSRVFEPFFTTKETGKGTGLGLSMVFGFVKQSGGHISIYSEVGAGTTVRIYLPRIAGTAEEAHAAPSAPLRRGNETILVVEDNESLRRTLVKQLIELGYTVLEADNGHRALTFLTGEPNIDLLLTDIVMPGGLNGWELARQAGEIRPDLKLLFTSGFPEASFERGTAIPADARLLGKPYRKAELAEKVREALAA